MCAERLVYQSGIASSMAETCIKIVTQSMLPEGSQRAFESNMMPEERGRESFGDSWFRSNAHL